MPDSKGIGKAVNDVLGGIGSVVAGAFLGTAGASGVQMAASGVDRLIDAVVPDANKPPTSGSAPRPETTREAPAEKPLPPTQETRSRGQAPASPARSAPPPLGEHDGDAHSAEELLRAAGWDLAEVLAALRGPEHGRAVLAKRTEKRNNQRPVNSDEAS